MNSPQIEVSVFIATSLDGFIARPDGDVAWLDEVEPFEDGDDGGFGAFFEAIDVLVMGRGSFEKVMEFEREMGIAWPYGTKPVMVLSKSLREAPETHRDRVRIDSSSPRELLEKLSAGGYRRIYLDGGKVIQSFLREGLVDDMTITTIPVLIGQGIPLFGQIEEDIKLHLLEFRSWANGLVQSKYQVLK